MGMREVTPSFSLKHKSQLSLGLDNSPVSCLEGVEPLLIFFGCAGSWSFSLVAASRGYSLFVVRGLLIVMASLVAEHKALGCRLL